MRAEAQFGRIVGLADSAPYDAENPENPANRRISIVVLNRATERAIGLNERPPAPQPEAASDPAQDQADNVADPVDGEA